MSKSFKQGDWVWDRDTEGAVEVLEAQHPYVGVRDQEGESWLLREDALLSLEEFSASLPVGRRRK